MIRSKISVIVLAVTLGLTLTACGSTRTERGLSGAGIGAGIGAAGAALTGGSAVTGAVVGGAAGAAAGVLTNKKQINLGD